MVMKDFITFFNSLLYDFYLYINLLVNINNVNCMFSGEKIFTIYKKYPVIPNSISRFGSFYVGLFVYLSNVH